MPELKLESLAHRVAELERQMSQSKGVIPASRDWKSVAGMFEGSEFMKQVDKEVELMRAAEQAELDRG